MSKIHRDKPATQGDIDNVVAAVVKGFDELSKKIDERFDGVEGRLDKVEDTLEEVKFDVRDIKRRVTDLEGDTASVSQVVDHERRIKKLESRVFTTV